MSEDIKPVEANTEKQLTIAERYSSLVATLFTLNKDICPNLNLESMMNLDIIAKQVEAETKILIAHALFARREEFDRSVAVLKLEIPKVIIELIASAEKILVDQIAIKEKNLNEEPKADEVLEPVEGEVIPA